MLFTWLRWLIWGRTLEESLAKLVKIQEEFEDHAVTARARKAAKEVEIEDLQVQTAKHAAEIEQAELVANNFNALRTQRLSPE